jgi:hypothetical protein
MTDIDRTADIDVSRFFAQVTVRIPLTGHVTHEWVSHFTNLARMWTAHEGTPSPGTAKASSKPKTYLTTVAGSSSGFPLLLITPSSNRC